MASGDDEHKVKDRFVSRIDLSSSNLDSLWQKFKSQFKVFALAKSMSKLSEEEQIANMLVLMGPESVDIYDQFVYNEGDHKRTLKNVISDFDKHFQPVKNIIYERMMFNQIVQKPTQTIHQFITELQSQAGNCEFGVMTGELVRDRIVVGARDQKLREYLVDVDDLDLNKCIQKAKQYTSSRAQVSHMSQEDNLDAINQRTPKPAANPTDQSTGSTLKTGNGKYEYCFFCGRENHPRERCPARDSRCNRCRGVGHWSRGKACRGRRKDMGKRQAVSELELSEDTQELFLGSITD